MTARGTRHLPVTSRYDDRRADSSGKRLSELERTGPWQKGQSSLQYVHAIERGKSHGKPETLAAIRKALEKAGVQFTNGKHPGVRLNGQR
jgi:hypothetical protein